MCLKLLPSSALICLAILSSGFALKTPFFADPCDKIGATVKLTKDQNSMQTATVEITGAQQPIRYIFSDSKNELIATDYSKSQVKSLKPGKYTCLIREASGCRKLIEFEVK